MKKIKLLYSAFNLTEQQINCLIKVSDIELNTQHKYNPNIPVCIVHDNYNDKIWFE